MLKLLITGLKIQSIESRLKLIYTDELVDEVLGDMNNPEDIFRYHELPHCYNCEKCEIVNSCKFIDIIKINKRIQQIHAKNKIDQSKLKYELI